MCEHVYIYSHSVPLRRREYLEHLENASAFVFLNLHIFSSSFLFSVLFTVNDKPGLWDALIPLLGCSWIFSVVLDHVCMCVNTTDSLMPLEKHSAKNVLKPKESFRGQNY